MTKYILAGGSDLEHPEYFTKLAQVIRVSTRQPRILSCWFSESDNAGKKKFELFKNIFQTHFGSNTPVILAETITFVQQVRQADVIYLHGGHTKLLLESMRHYADIEVEFKDKIVIGSSAGANYLSYAYFSSGRDVVEKGMGIVDVSVLVHYGITSWKGREYRDDIWQSAVEQLEIVAPEKEVLYLPEGTFSVIEKV